MELLAAVKYVDTEDLGALVDGLVANAEVELVAVAAQRDLEMFVLHAGLPLT